MMSTRLMYSGLVLVVGLSITVEAAQRYSVRDLGPISNVGGRTESQPLAINLQGRVSAVNAVNNAYRAMLYASTWQNLGTLGGTESFAAGMNDQGQVVGSSLLPNGDKHAFVWTGGGTDGISGNPQMKDLGALQGNESAAFDVNNAGQIAGYVMVGKQAHVFIYAGGKMTDLGRPFSAYPNTFAYGINGAGHLAGAAYDANYNETHAYYYNGTAAVDLGTFGGTSATAMALNDSDLIVGYFTTAKGVDHAFQTAGTAMTDLGTLGGNYSYANAVNNHGLVVGGAFTDVQDTVYHAFLAENKTMTDLNSLLDATSSGWTLQEARGINDAGQIVGVGLIGNQRHIFLLDPISATSVSVSLRLQGKDAIVSFPSVAGAHYSVQRVDNLGGAWGTLGTTLTGNGAVLSATDAGAGQLPRRFYRVSTTGQ